MTLPSSGQIAASNINIELNRGLSAPFDMNSQEVRLLAHKPTGAINFSDLYGKKCDIGTLNAAQSPSFFDQIGFNSGAYGAVSSTTGNASVILQLHQAINDGAPGYSLVLQFDSRYATVTNTTYSALIIYRSGVLSSPTIFNFSAASGTSNFFTWPLTPIPFFADGSAYNFAFIY